MIKLLIINRFSSRQFSRVIAVMKSRESIHVTIKYWKEFFAPDVTLLEEKINHHCRKHSYNICTPVFPTECNLSENQSVNNETNEQPDVNTQTA